MNLKTKSPLKAKPLRNPGQSLDKEIDRLLNDKLIFYLLITTFFIAYAAMEWYRWYANAPYSPLQYTIIAILITSFSVFNGIKIRKKVKLLKLGLDGEKAVGQFLELMRERGYKIFHDIVGEKFNIDHVIICKNGIFTIETKTFSKPINGRAKIEYDGKKITVNGHETFTNILAQAKAEAHWLKNFFKESTGKEIQVKPVVVFPGWWIENSAAGYNPEVWVVNPKALAEFVPKSGMDLQNEEIHMFSNVLSRFIRNHLD